MMSLYCANSMLPCGRYYSEPEGGYVGNPWVKFSYQYMYLYLGWLLHHLDLIDHYIFQYTQTLLSKRNSLRRSANKEFETNFGLSNTFSIKDVDTFIKADNNSVK
jgi:hypothetical protein